MGGRTRTPVKANTLEDAAAVLRVAVKRARGALYRSLRSVCQRVSPASGFNGAHMRARAETHHYSRPQRCLLFVVMYPMRLCILSERDNANLVYPPNPAEILIDDLCHWTSSPGAYLGLHPFAYSHSYCMGKLHNEVRCCAFLQLLGDNH